MNIKRKGTNRRSLLLTGVSRGYLGRMTALEQRLGRYIRDPEDHPTLDLPDVLDSLDKVPAKLQPFYVKDEASGKFKLDDVGSLRSTVGHIKNENKELKGKASSFKAYEELGMTAEEIKQLKADRDAAKENKLKEEGDWNALREQMEANHAAALEAANNKANKVTGTLKKVLIDDNARAALAAEDIQGNPTLLLPAIRGRVDITETEDGFSVVVKREDGAPMLNAQNQPATLRDLFIELKGKPEYAGAFKGVNQSGGGAPAGQDGQGGGGAPAGSLKRSTMSAKQKAEYIREKGQADYEKLPW